MQRAIRRIVYPLCLTGSARRNGWPRFLAAGTAIW
jgi:hypothetical protein